MLGGTPQLLDIGVADHDIAVCRRHGAKPFDDQRSASNSRDDIRRFDAFDIPTDAVLDGKLAADDRGAVDFLTVFIENPRRHDRLQTNASGIYHEAGLL